MIRVGVCSLYACALESADGSINNVRARSRHVRAQPRGHYHKKPWQVVVDTETDYRYWHDLVPRAVRF